MSKKGLRKPCEKKGSKDGSVKKGWSKMLCRLRILCQGADMMCTVLLRCCFR